LSHWEYKNGEKIEIKDIFIISRRNLN
jgi:hypothetical protein